MAISLRSFAALPLVLALAGCDSGGSRIAASCPETGPHACQSGQTEPLYTFQWALNHAASFFRAYPAVSQGGLDLNVEPLHRQGLKGQGVRVLVLDSGTDFGNEDLRPNADLGMSHNMVTGDPDPYPGLLDRGDAHGTVVAGIIGAAQNGKGVMGIAPMATLGASNFLTPQGELQIFAAYGGAPWSSQAHVINASYGDDDILGSYENPGGKVETFALRGLKNLRGGKGVVFVKAAGNGFSGPSSNRPCRRGGIAYYGCFNPANDVEPLEPNVIAVAALNARGERSSYSSAGSLLWVTGMGGESGFEGTYGEGGDKQTAGPSLFSTDIRGCVNGYSYSNAKAPHDIDTPFMRGVSQRDGRLDNPDCDYAYMNGTSAAAPSISGVVALVLGANPELGWRDVRDILRLSARKVDADYPRRIPHGGDRAYGAPMNLKDNTLSATIGGAGDIADGSTVAPMTLGWQVNGAGLEHSDWYGFGVPDAEKAVALARDYARDPARGRRADVTIPAFAGVAYWHKNTPDPAHAGVPNREFNADGFPYQRVSLAGTLTGAEQLVDEFQVRLTGAGVCLGSMGIAVRSPSGTVSLLKLSGDHFSGADISTFDAYALGSYAFYGEAAQGDWQIYAVAGNPDEPVGETMPKCASLAGGVPRDFKLFFEARIIAQ